jgi:mevalonate kinase
MPEIDTVKLKRLLEEADLEEVAERIAAYHATLRRHGIKKKQAEYLTQRMHDYLCNWLFPTFD